MSNSQERANNEDTENARKRLEADKEALGSAVVGHRIVHAERVVRPFSDAEMEHGRRVDEDLLDDCVCSWDDERPTVVLTLDTGEKVTVREASNYYDTLTEVEQFLLHPESVDHMITGVRTEDDYTQWFIYADFGDLLRLTVNWNEGSGYYGFGFFITVDPAPAQ